MIGTNTLQFNESTMCEIVQYWLDNKLLNPNNHSPVVMQVKASGEFSPTFSITLQSDENK